MRKSLNLSVRRLSWVLHHTQAFLFVREASFVGSPPLSDKGLGKGATCRELGIIPNISALEKLEG